MEIRCVVGKPDGWEVVSPRGCCIFDWERTAHGGVLYVEDHHCRRCAHDLLYYAVGRGYVIQERRGRIVTLKAC